MKIIIAGIGKLGEYLTKSLVKDGNDVTIVDLDFSTNKDLINNEDVNYVYGNALDANVLIEAGVEDADLLISVMEKDEHNIICSMIANKLGTKHTIARIRSIEYSTSVNLLKSDLGLSMRINPEQLTAASIARALSIPSALEATSFLRGKLQVISLKVKGKSVLDNLKVHNLSKKYNLSVIVCAIQRDGETIIPSGKERIKSGDIISVAGSIKYISEFLNFANLISEKTKNVIIAGGSSTSIYLAQSLIDMKMKVKIIEIDEEKCRELSEKLPGALIINADVSDQNILYEEGIESADAFISLTNIDEENIVYSMFASMKKVPKIITKINHIDLEGITDKANIDTVITPHRIAANHVVKFVRAMQNSKKSSCEAIYKLGDDIFEMQEFFVKNDFKGKNKKIKDMNIKENILIVAIQRGKNIIMPSGEETIKLNDTIVLIDGNDSIKNINDILG